MPRGLAQRQAFWLVAALLIVAAVLRGGAGRGGPSAGNPRARGGPRAAPGGSVSRAPRPAGEHTALGVPSDGDPSDDLLLDEGEYLVSYNPRRRVPNWVAWSLEASDLGYSPRRAHFRTDEDLPADLYRVTPRDYAHSGYDRGHLCPSADRSGSEEAAAATFLMVNVQPQLHELNAGPWEKLEAYSRGRVKSAGSELLIVAGGIFDSDPATIGHGIAVPKAIFKIIVEVRPGEGTDGVSPSTRTLAVEMPNEPGVRERQWMELVTSIDRIERDTGYDFLSLVPPPVQEAIEARTQLSL